ncbi:MAG TPA: DUF6457 domain-containing protein [Mycobacteriales bacterium]|jgi:hypothetical protein|nr:DUF6457 domain-containing protein [Mycobacteriales bacterium]
MTLDQWMRAVCDELGIEPVDARAVLDLARDVAHGVDRPAAPLTCLLIGMAATGADDLDSLITRVRALIPAP